MMKRICIEINFSEFADGFSFLKALLDLEETTIDDFWIDDDGDVRIVVGKGFDKEGSKE